MANKYKMNATDIQVLKTHTNAPWRGLARSAPSLSEAYQLMMKNMNIENYHKGVRAAGKARKNRTSHEMWLNHARNNRPVKILP